jgi:cell division protein ZipA
MDILRTVLIVLGVALVVGIYLADRLKRRRKEGPEHWNEIDFEQGGTEDTVASQEALPDEWVGKAVTITAKRHEQLADEQLEGLKGLGAQEKPEAPSEPVDAHTLEQPEAQSVAAAPQEAIIVLTLMAGKGKRFSGPLLLKVLQEVGLEHGEMDIFHFHVAGKEQALFSVANILEPGRFELSEMAALETPGLALFLRLPAVLDGPAALETLLQRARQIAAQLGGTLCDERRAPLDEEAEARLQARAAPFSPVP